MELEKRVAELEKTSGAKLEERVAELEKTSGAKLEERVAELENDWRISGNTIKKTFKSTMKAVQQARKFITTNSKGEIISWNNNLGTAGLNKEEFKSILPIEGITSKQAEKITRRASYASVIHSIEDVNTREDTKLRVVSKDDDISEVIKNITGKPPTPALISELKRNMIGAVIVDGFRLRGTLISTSWDTEERGYAYVTPDGYAHDLKTNKWVEIMAKTEDSFTTNAKENEFYIGDSNIPYTGGKSRARKQNRRNRTHRRR